MTVAGSGSGRGVENRRHASCGSDAGTTATSFSGKAGFATGRPLPEPRAHKLDAAEPPETPVNLAGGSVLADPLRPYPAGAVEPQGRLSPAGSFSVLDLFSGIGGISLGLESTGGFHTIAFCEVDPFCREVLRHHWPGVPIHEDVRGLSVSALGGLQPDVLVGGFPCQPFSVAGKQKAQNDERHLWPEFARLIRELRPRWVIAENVPGIRTLAADEVLADLEAAGYSCWPLVVGADDVGAPHRRKRVWFVAYRNRNGHDGDGRHCASEPRSNRAQDGVFSSRGGADGASELSNSDAGRCGGPGDAVRAGRDEPERTDSAVGLADRYEQGQHQQRGGGVLDRERAARGDHADGRGERAVGDTERRGRQAGEPQRAWAGAALPSGEARWPARPGEPQYDWEEPRLADPTRNADTGSSEAAGADGERTRPADHENGGARGSELPLGGATDGLPERLARRANREALRALGNSVVPQVVQAIGRAIFEVENSLRSRAAGIGPAESVGEAPSHDSSALKMSVIGGPAPREGAGPVSLRGE